MSLGPLMPDIEGTVLSAADRDLLRHPLVGGVILFSRNYESPRQLQMLTAEIHSLRQPPLLIAVDQEGGRVQRFREGFTRLPACARYGELYDKDGDQAVQLAHQAGSLLAAELRAAGVDFSFTPVLDLGRGISKVIDDRAFHRSPEIIVELARAMMQGMHESGMAAVGKHFPGHGSVAADSHHALPQDLRRSADIYAEDLLPFERMIHYGLPAIMPAHVVYPQIDRQPAGFSKRWIDGILRKELGFQGAVFSDDLSMEGAAGAGDPLQRAQQALAAGCDMLPVCNDRAATVQIVEGLGPYHNPASQIRLLRLHGRLRITWEEVRSGEKWQSIRKSLSWLDPEPELDLHDDSSLN